MKRNVSVFRALSGSQYVYFTEDQDQPAGTSLVSLAGSAQIKNAIASIGTPLEAWTLNGESGLTGSIDGTLLSVSTGTKVFGPGPIAGTQSLFTNGSTRWIAPSTGSLIITGAVTVMVTIFPVSVVSTEVNVINCVGNAASDLESENFLYDIRLRANNSFAAFFETGPGTNVFLERSPVFSIKNGEWQHLTYRLDSAGTGSLFYNGEFVHSAATGLPTGGSNARLRLANDGNSSAFYTGYIFSLKIYNSALTNEQIRVDAQSIIGD